MNPTEPPQQRGTAGGFLFGAIFIMVIGAVLSIFGFAAIALGGGLEKIPCRQAYGEGGVLLLIALIAAALAWVAFFRIKTGGFGLGFLRGIAIGALLVVLVPWPCSYPSAAYDNVATCTH
jgi:membrane protease YdiL (CAAX protease family)